MTCNPNPKPLSSAEGMMKSWPYKNFSGRLEKRRICCISLYAIYVFGLFFFFFVPRNIAGYIVSIWSFLLLPPPTPTPTPTPTIHTPKINPWNGRFFIFLFALTVFRKRRGGWIPPFCTFVTFVHGNHTGAF